jgi:hypothetical protein
VLSQSPVAVWLLQRWGEHCIESCSGGFPLWRSLGITVFGTYQGASTVRPKAFDWKCSKISVLEVEAIPQSYIPQAQIGLSIVLYVKSLLLMESFDLRLINQYILVWVIHSTLTIDLYLVSRSSMCGTIPPLAYTSACFFLVSHLAYSLPLKTEAVSSSKSPSPCTVVHGVRSRRQQWWLWFVVVVRRRASPKPWSSFVLRTIGQAHFHSRHSV